MNILDILLEVDLLLLQKASTIIDAKYAFLVQVSGEFIVLYGALILLGLWIFGVYSKNPEYKKNALSIFFTICIVFVVYAVINLGIPQWRLGAMEAVEGITPLIPHPIDNSFPSGHALFTGALLMGVYQYFRRSWLICSIFIVGIITLTARVIGGVHYPGDILGGLMIGSVGGYFLKTIVEYLVRILFPLFLKIASWIRL